MASSRSIAAVVCPSAPFLVPRRACAVFRNVHPNAGSVAAKHNAARPPNRGPETQSSFLRMVKSKQRKVSPPPQVDEPAAELSALFRQHCEALNLEEVIGLYPLLHKKRLVTHNDTLHIARTIHTYFRRLPHGDRPRAMPVLMYFADRIITHICAGTIPPNPPANAHLLSFLKEAGQFDCGSEFWEWLRRKDANHVNAFVYGAAIELKTVEGKTDLAELEHMYASALNRFPGNFAQYHLSPDAIVPDRGQLVMIRGLPVGLLQGISYARLVKGDWRNAYLALDTALRLFPTQVPAHFFEMFIHERPLAEAYTVFIVACRSGIALKPGHLTVLLTKLVDSQYRASAYNKAQALKGMLNAMHAYVGVGGSIGAHHLSALVKGFRGLLPRESPQEDEVSQTVNELIGSIARNTVQAVSQAGVRLTPSVFSSLTLLAGQAKLPGLLGRTIQDMSAADLVQNEVTHRSLVVTAGNIKHLELVEVCWGGLVEAAEASGRQLEFRDWQVLARACVNAGHVEFLREQMSSLSHTMTDDIASGIAQELAKESPDITESQEVGRGGRFTEADYARVSAALQEIKTQVESLLALINSGKLIEFHKHCPPSTLVARPAIGSDMALRAVYDELTTDPGLPTTKESLRPAMKSASGYPLDALRYANWMSINELLLEAEAYEAECQRRMAEALKEGDDTKVAEAAKPARPVLSWRRSTRKKGDSAGSDAEDGRACAADGSDEVGRVRQEIRRLRTLQDQPTFAADP